MYRVAAVLLVVVLGAVAGAGIVQAKGPPIFSFSKVVVSGGDLGSAIVIPRGDLAGLSQSGIYAYTDSGSYNETVAQSEDKYEVRIYTGDPSSGQEAFFWQLYYYPPTGAHPALVTGDIGLQPPTDSLSSLLDRHISAARAGGGVPVGWLAAGAIAVGLAVSAAIGSYALRRARRLL